MMSSAVSTPESPGSVVERDGLRSDVIRVWIIQTASQRTFCSTRADGQPIDHRPGRFRCGHSRTHHLFGLRQTENLPLRSSDQLRCYQSDSNVRLRFETWPTWC